MAKLPVKKYILRIEQPQQESSNEHFSKATCTAIVFEPIELCSLNIDDGEDEVLLNLSRNQLEGLAFWLDKLAKEMP